VRNDEEERWSSYISAWTSQYNVNNVFSSNFSAPDVQHSDLLSEIRFFTDTGEQECKHVDRVFVVEDNRCRYSTAGAASPLRNPISNAYWYTLHVKTAGSHCTLTTEPTDCTLCLSYVLLDLRL